MTDCLVCRAEAVEPILDFGVQPVTCHFLQPNDADAALHPLALGVCASCGIAQLMASFPAEALTPPYSWISYREPEDHLDALVDDVLGLEGMGPEAAVLGLSFKDRSTIERLRRKGITRSGCLDVHSDLGARSPNANIEAVHAGLTSTVAQAIVDARGPADLVVARHVAEHAASPIEFIEAISMLARDGGYVVLEVPDSARNLELCDYTMVWEEHTLYLTEATVRLLLRNAPLQEISLTRHVYPFEDIFVLIARKVGRRAGGTPAGDIVPHLADSVQTARDYAAAFPAWTQRYRDAISRLSDGKPATLYGAGHLTAAFVNLHGLADLFSFVVDDTPEKQGHGLPNSRLPIVAAERLVEDDAALCLLGLSPANEDKVIAKNRGFVEGGGIFRSIFADSSRSLRTNLP